MHPCTKHKYAEWIFRRKRPAQGKVMVKIPNIVVSPNQFMLFWLRNKETSKSSQSSFASLLSVVKKLASRGYQHHLFDLLMALNFNEYYENKR